MSYSSAIEYLYGLQKHGIKLGLEKTSRIMSLFRDPYKDFRSIHVAGTNGKGSVSAMLASVLEAYGFRVGLFSSPHLVSFTERIRINNEQISEQDVVSLAEEVRDTIQNADPGLNPTFFEVVTAMAFLYFSRNGIDWVVLETGMGGRLDATNLVTPGVSVITKISLDHKEFLGETLTDVAREKAGIIKAGVPVISAEQDKDASDVIEAAAQEKSCPLFIYGKDFEGKLTSSEIHGITFDYRDGMEAISDVAVPLAGEHQVLNACLAIKSATFALDSFDPPLFKKGLSSVRWPGRLEMVSDNPPIMIDGAHNPDASQALSRYLKKHFDDRKIILVMGVMSDKDIRGIISPLLPLASEVIFTAPNYGRAASPQLLAGYASEMGYVNARVAGNVESAMETAEQLASKDERLPSPLILITGSFYTIGEAMETLGEKAVLGRLRETL